MAKKKKRKNQKAKIIFSAAAAAVLAAAAGAGVWFYTTQMAGSREDALKEYWRASKQEIMKPCTDS